MPLKTAFSISLRCLSLAALTFLTQVCAMSEEAAPPDEDKVTRQLAELVRKSETQVEAGKPDEALQTLKEAWQLAAEAKRPEAGQMDARIDRIRSAMNAPKAAEGATSVFRMCTP